MNENDFKSKFKTSAEVLKSLFEEKAGGPVSEQFLRWKLWLNWADIVGPTTAEHTEPVSYHNGVLYLWVKNSTWMQQMTFISETIKNTINQKFKKNFVTEIRYTLDRKNTPTKENLNFQKNLKKFVK
jgi:predicted nucleic acid-binding Zn ribbon protein